MNNKNNSQIFYKKAFSTLKPMLQSLSNDYYFDMHIANYYTIDGYYKIENTDKITNTKEVYCKYHPEFDIEAFNRFPNSFLEKIVKNDTTIYFDERYIFLELYKILGLIHRTMHLREYIQSPKYTTKLKSNQTTKAQKNLHKKNILPSSNIYDKGEHRLNFHFLNSLQKEKKITKFFLEVITLNDLDKMSFTHNEKQETLEKTMNFFENRLTQKTTDGAILKSLGILLHYEFKNYLKIEDTKSKEYIVDLISYIFKGAKVNDDEFNRHIYISSTVSFMPIFGAKKNKHFLTREKNIIRDILFKELNQGKPYKLNLKVIDHFLEQHLQTQHLEYLKKYPEELFKINKKYSHLKPNT